jgi:hypothetical protein
VPKRHGLKSSQFLLYFYEWLAMQSPAAGNASSAKVPRARNPCNGAKANGPHPELAGATLANRLSGGFSPCASGFASGAPCKMQVAG